MANLAYKSLDNIGINALNTQSNPTTLDASWLTAADNIVLRESGRISFRKGFKQNILANTDGTAGATLKIGAIGENDAGTIVAAVGTKMYTVDFSTPDTPASTIPMAARFYKRTLKPSCRSVVPNKCPEMTPVKKIQKLSEKDRWRAIGSAHTARSPPKNPPCSDRARIGGWLLSSRKPYPKNIPSR